MYSNVVFFRDKEDSQYQDYLKVFLACKKANIDLPKQIDDYFGGDGLDNDIEEPLQISFEPRKWTGNSAEGLEIDIDKIPSGVKTIRFFNSW